MLGINQITSVALRVCVCVRSQGVMSAGSCGEPERGMEMDVMVKLVCVCMYCVCVRVCVCVCAGVHGPRRRRVRGVRGG